MFTCISRILLLFMYIFPIPVVECFFTNRLSSALLTNCVLSVANRALNVVLVPLSAVVINRSSSALAANCSSSCSFISTHVIGQCIHGHMHIR